MRVAMTISRNLALLSLLAVFSGCAEVHSAVKSDSQALQAKGSVLRDIRVTGDGGTAQVVLSADRPLAYTFYKTSSPPKAVVDLAQVEPGAFAKPMEISTGNITRIEAVRHGEGAAAMTRVEVHLTRDTEVTAAIDPRDKGTLVLAFAAPPAPAVSAAAAPVAAQPSPAEKTTVTEPKALAEAAVAPSPAAPGEAVKPAPETAAPAAVEPKPAPREEAKETAVTAIAAGKDSLEIRTSGAVPEFKTFRLSKPDRLVVDIIGARAGIAAKVVPINSLGIGTARIGAYPDKVRIVFDAVAGSLPTLSVEKTDSGLKVVPSAPSVDVPRAPLTPAAAPAPAKPRQPEAAPAPEKAPKAGDQKVAARPGIPSVESIDFKVTDGASRLSVAVSGGCDAEKPQKSAEGVTFTLKNCVLPAKWQRFLDTSAFASVVQRVTPYQVKVKGRSDVKVQVKLRQEAPFELRRDGDVVSLELKHPAGLEAPAVAEELAGAAVPERPKAAAAQVITAPPAGESKKVYTGRRVTLEFSDADIRKIFQLIAEVSNLNFLVGDDVSGTISLKLVNVPWDQALDVILENKGLGMQRDGNIVQIRPKSKIQTLADEEQAMKKAKERAMELKTEVFDINFATVGDVVSQFSALKSERGTITQDSRTNRVIVKDIAPNLEDMKFLLKNLDSPERQVMIEARIVEATSTFTRDLGVKWGVHYNDGSASLVGINRLDTGFGGSVTPPPTVGIGDPTSAGGSLGISFGKLTSNVQVDMRLSAAATAGLVKIISTPKVVTLNNKAAKISQGQSIPYQTTSAEGTKTEFVEAALTLEVTPHITADGSVVMKIKASNNSPGSGTPPPINKKEATTELLVKNGETTVIGGIYVDNDTTNDSGVPFLMDIPLLGWLFKSNTKTKTKTELLIFITPKVVS